MESRKVLCILGASKKNCFVGFHSVLLFHCPLLPPSPLKRKGNSHPDDLGLWNTELETLPSSYTLCTLSEIPSSWEWRSDATIAQGLSTATVSWTRVCRAWGWRCHRCSSLHFRTEIISSKPLSFNLLWHELPRRIMAQSTRRLFWVMLSSPNKNNRSKGLAVCF